MIGYFGGVILCMCGIAGVVAVNLGHYAYSVLSAIDINSITVWSGQRVRDVEVVHM